MEKVIEIKNLSRSFGEVQAVQGLTLSVRRGELFAFLGVNGAGKSTTISMLSGSLKPDSGEIYICGESISGSLKALYEKLGVVFQGSVLDKALTVKDNLSCRAALYGLNKKTTAKKIEELSELLEFKSFLNRPVGKLSGGQRRRIDIARALLNDPEILILDEPTTGLDPQTRRLLWDAIHKLRTERGMTVFLTTHYMEEAADADYVVVLESGKIAAEGTPLALKNKYTGDFITLYGVDEEKIKALNLPYTSIRDAFRVEVKNTAAATELIKKYPELFSDYEITKGKMDDVFLNVTGNKIDGGDES